MVRFTLYVFPREYVCCQVIGYEMRRQDASLNAESQRARQAPQAQSSAAPRVVIPIPSLLGNNALKPRIAVRSMN